jgi:hypothetical protein
MRRLSKWMRWKYAFMLTPDAPKWNVRDTSGITHSRPCHQQRKNITNMKMSTRRQMKQQPPIRHGIYSLQSAYPPQTPTPESTTRNSLQYSISTTNTNTRINNTRAPCAAGAGASKRPSPTACPPTAIQAAARQRCGEAAASPGPASSPRGTAHVRWRWRACIPEVRWGSVK